jgi:SAM-dependent methyltransferase
MPTSESSNPFLFEYEGKNYPAYIKTGNAASFVVPFAKHFCKGKGLDIGGFFDWTFPGAKPINICIEDEWDAYHLPDEKYNYIFSSHTLEHLPAYVKALEYWKDHLLPQGVLFLYLPHPEMEYWLPQRNRKHLHSFYPQDIMKVLKDIGFPQILHSERDLYWSFSVVALLE